MLEVGKAWGFENVQKTVVVPKRGVDWFSNRSRRLLPSVAWPKISALDRSERSDVQHRTNNWSCWRRCAYWFCGGLHYRQEQQESDLRCLKGPKGERRPADVIGAAILVGPIATGDSGDKPSKTPNRAKGSKVGGKARAKASHLKGDPKLGSFLRASRLSQAARFLK